MKDPPPGCPRFVPLERITATTVFAPKLFGLITTSRRALNVAADWGEEPYFVMPDPAVWIDAIGQARADVVKTPPDLAKLLSAAEAEHPRVFSPEMFGNFLQNDRGFPGGFWHPDDEDAVLGVMTDRLKGLGLPGELLADEGLRAELRRMAESCDDDDAEDRARRLQIARVAARVNEAAGAAGGRRLYAFAEDVPGWESEEPVWLHLTADERARLLALGIVRLLGP